MLAAHDLDAEALGPGVELVHGGGPEGVRGAQEDLLVFAGQQVAREEFQNDIGLTGTSDPDELKAFLKHILPDYDEERVYVSDIKKLVNWYNVLVSDLPEIFKEDSPKKEAKEEKPAEKEKKTARKKGEG